MFTILASMLMPIGIAFLIFIAKNPAVSDKLGLLNAKANLLAYSAIDWQSYLLLNGQIVAAAGFLLSILVISWVFGREFTDGTLKDMLAVPVQRSSILLAKFMIVAVWSAVLAIVVLVVGLIVGVVLGLPGGSPSAIVQATTIIGITAILTIALVLPFALFASVGRGYLLPIGMAVMTLMVTNLLAVVGLGDYFPWAVAGLYAQGKGTLPAISYWIVLVTALVGIVATYVWWKIADQTR
jgi:ABC-2 type transport system permease protein